MINNFFGYIMFDLFSLPSAEKYLQAVQYFCSTAVYIFFLMIIVFFIISFLQTFLNFKKIREKLNKDKFCLGYFASAMFGALSPFCSCSSIPIFYGIVKAKLPLGHSFAFLTTSPLVNNAIFVIMLGFFGWNIALIYAFVGIFLGIISGLIINKTMTKKEIISAKDISTMKWEERNMPKNFREKISFSMFQTTNMLKNMANLILLGIAIASIIVTYLPNDFFINLIGNYGFLSVPIAVIIGIPVYLRCSTVIPIIAPLMMSGLPLGTGIAFLMSVAGLSLPEAIMLRKVISTKLLIFFFSIVGIEIICVGYFFNWFFG